MTYGILISKQAKRDLEDLSPPTRKTIENRLVWLANNAESVIHHPLHGMPHDLAGICRFKVADYRILYWLKAEDRTLRIYRIMHRSEVYRRLS